MNKKKFQKVRCPVSSQGKSEAKKLTELTEETKLI